MSRILLFAGLLVGAAGPVWAQQPSAAFLERAKAATEKYRDQASAILDGYRPIGRDFPGMGEHWVRVSLLFDGKIDAEHPEFLTYVPVSGRPRLLGVAYALPLLPGESAPDLPAGKDAWHDHFRTVDDETVLPHHHHSGNAEDEPRLTMLHAWIWAPNPDGVFAADNWAIPYIRLGMPPPDHAPRAAALALSLMFEGVEYFSMMVDAVASPGRTQRTRIAAAFARARSAVEREIHEGDHDRLAAIWKELWKSIEAAIGAHATEQIRALLPK